MKKTFCIALICAFIDQIIKNILMNIMNIGESIIIIKNFFNITLVSNSGAAFSILDSKTTFLILISIVVLIGLIYYVIKGKDIKKNEYVIYGVLMGGIIGNLIDRIIYASVIDYLDFNIFEYNYPIFNFADMCIVISMILIVFEMIKGGYNEVSSK